MSRLALLLQAWGWGCPALRPRRLAYLKSDGWSSKRLNSCQGTNHAGNTYYSLDQNRFTLDSIGLLVTVAIKANRKNCNYSWYVHVHTYVEAEKGIRMLSEIEAMGYKPNKSLPVKTRFLKMFTSVNISVFSTLYISFYHFH